MATKRKTPRGGGGRSGGARPGRTGRTLLVTGGLGAVAVAGFLALGHFSGDDKPRPAPAAAQKPRPSASASAPAPAPGPRYGAEDRDRLSRLAALPGGTSSTPGEARRPSAPTPALVASAARPAPLEAFVPPAEIPPPERPGSRRMSAAEWRVLDTALADQLRRCWPQAEARGGGYVPVIKVEFDASGALARKPVLIGARNPQEIAAGEALANAVARCGPLPVPPDLRPFHAQWKVRTIRLDPPQMSGL